MYQKVQTVKDDLGSPKSSLFLYLNNKPSYSSSFSIALTVSMYLGSLLSIKP